MSTVSSPPTRGSESRGAAPRGRRGRSVPVVYAAVTAVLLLGVLALALSSPPPRTPPLAAVAPQVDEQVEVERVEQSSQFGQGAGGEGDCAPGDAGCAAAGSALQDQAQGQVIPQATSAPADFWPCILGPRGARQTEDPQSPPCKAERFKGDNGGATWRGVTATEIRIGFPMVPNDVPVEEAAVLALVGHINRRYELHGRQLRLVPISPPDGFRSKEPASHRAFAQETVAADVFATLGYRYFGPYQKTLAEHGVINVMGGLGSALLFESELQALHPYTWNVYPSFEDAMTASGELICESLMGRPAQHGGDEVRDRIRRFGILQEVPGPNRVHYEASILTSRLAACGADFLVYDYHNGEDETPPIFRKMRDDGVTTVVCVCSSLRISDHGKRMEEFGWHPEWFLPGIADGQLYLRYGRTDNTGQPRAQLAHVFGLLSSMRKPQVDVNAGKERFEEQYWFHAARESDPEFEPENASSLSYYGYYAELLMLASGIQWAGPDLTPDTFAGALTGLRYANPGVGTAPWFQPSVGFGPNDHSFNSDFSLAWWQDPSDAGWESRTDFGRLCYVAAGARFRPGAIPEGTDERFFNPEAGCR